MILRHGMGAESLAWLAVFTLSPISAVYYPVSILPRWLQHVAWALPSTYVFEGMRTLLFQKVFRADYLVTAGGARHRLAGAGRRRLFYRVSRRPPPRRAAADGRMRRPTRYGPAPSTVKPCFSKAGLAAGDSRKCEELHGVGFLLAAVSATG